MITGFMLLWAIITVLSIGFIVYDQLTNTPSLRIMTWAWCLFALFTGPVGLFLYLVSCRQPLPNTHDEFIKSHWKQAVGSLIHCVAGDATAIVVSAVILSFFTISNLHEVMIEYVVAYLFGLFIFQALFMLDMFPNYLTAVRKTIFAETVSMNMVMFGMFPTIVLLKESIPGGDSPAHAAFWLIMCLATIVGFCTAYPINSWMVRRGVKHGMMSQPMGAGDHGHAAAHQHQAVKHDHAQMGHGNMDHSHQHQHGEASSHEHSHAHHQMASLSAGLAWGISALTFALFLGVMYLVSCFVPLG